MKLFVGSLPFSTTENELQEMFEGCGNVLSVKIITDRETGRSRGFGFVEMSNQNEAEEAINTLNGKEMKGRTIVVKQAMERESSPPRNNGGGQRNRPPRNFNR